MIGIDVGTTSSKQSFVDKNGKPAAIPNARGEPATPSVVLRDRSGKCLVGTDAMEKGLIEPGSYVPSFKLGLGSTKSLLAKGKPLTATDAAAAVISALKAGAERHLGDAVTCAVLTVPVEFTDGQRQALDEAAKRSGIEVLRFISEPAAAYHAYSVAKNFDSQVGVVCDVGGGTSDIAILRVDGQEHRVVASSGDAKLGGNDFSEVIESRILDEVEKACGKRPDRKADGLFFLDLAARVDTAKKSLGAQKEVPVVVSYGGNQVVVKLTQSWFRKAVSPLLDRLVEVVERPFRDAGLTHGDVDRLIVVGGASRMPLVQERIADHLGLVPHADIDPQLAVAFGAALTCAHEMVRRGRGPTVKGHAIPAPKSAVRDATAHGVGCCVVDTSNPDRRLLNSVVIPKNSPIPCTETDRFMLQHDTQRAARIEILQGEAEAPREACCVIGEILLENLPPEPKRTERIEVKYSIDDKGMVTATATDAVSGASRTVSVDYKRGVQASGRSSAS